MTGLRFKHPGLVVAPCLVLFWFSMHRKTVGSSIEHFPRQFAIAFSGDYPIFAYGLAAASVVFAAAAGLLAVRVAFGRSPPNWFYLLPFVTILSSCLVLFFRHPTWHPAGPAAESWQALSSASLAGGVGLVFGASQLLVAATLLAWLTMQQHPKREDLLIFRSLSSWFEDMLAYSSLRNWLLNWRRNVFNWTTPYFFVPLTSLAFRFDATIEQIHPFAFAVLCAGILGSVILAVTLRSSAALANGLLVWAMVTGAIVLIALGQRIFTEGSIPPPDSVASLEHLTREWFEADQAVWQCLGALPVITFQLALVGGIYLSRMPQLYRPWRKGAVALALLFLSAGPAFSAHSWQRTTRSKSVLTTMLPAIPKDIELLPSALKPSIDFRRGATFVVRKEAATRLGSGRAVADGPGSPWILIDKHAPLNHVLEQLQQLADEGVNRVQLVAQARGALELPEPFGTLNSPLRLLSVQLRSDAWPSQTESAKVVLHAGGVLFKNSVQCRDAALGESNLEQRMLERAPYTANEAELWLASDVAPAALVQALAQLSSSKAASSLAIETQSARRKIVLRGKLTTWIRKLDRWFPTGTFLSYGHGGALDRTWTPRQQRSRSCRLIR